MGLTSESHCGWASAVAAGELLWQKEGLTRDGAGGVCAFVNSFDVPSAGWFSAFNPVFSLASA